MQFVSVDLGSTNLKAGVYDSSLKPLAWASLPVVYEKSEGFVEFDAEKYCFSLKKLLSGLIKNPEVKVGEIAQVSFTGQAESLVVLGKDNKPLMNAISWMDERSKKECRELEDKFDNKTYKAITGQRAILPTWPATKILWLRENKPQIFSKASCYMLLKDYVIYVLTGIKEADCSIATFSSYFDIYKKQYWKEMLNVIGISESQLPPLQEPCTVVGTLTTQAAKEIGLSDKVKVNRGTLDHFAGMIGAGAIEEGALSLSIGTVMAISALAKETEDAKTSPIAMHYGFIPDTHVMLSVAESGGISLEWFLKTCMSGVSLREVDNVLLKRSLPGKVLFLPYLVGTNAPEFNPSVKGAFYGLRTECDKFDMALAVMAGVSCLVKKNCDALEACGTKPKVIIASGGGSKSPVWPALIANFTKVPVIIASEKEAACYGAAIIAAVSEGVFSSLGEATRKLIKENKKFLPDEDPKFESYYKKFRGLYEAVSNLEAKLL